MVNTLTLLKDERVQYEGVFDLGELYKHVFNWLAWRKFDVSEKRYTERVKATGKEFRIEWEAKRDIDEYSAFQILVKWELFNTNDVEVKKNGATVKMQKGELNAYITANLLTDRQDYWSTNPAFAFMRSFYDRYLYRTSLERLKGELWKMGWEFFNEFKAFLNLYRY